MTEFSIDTEATGTDTLTVSRPSSPDEVSRARIGDDTQRASQRGVQAVVVERADGTCVLYGRGLSGTWPSIGDARAAFEEMSAESVWRETTPGVWVARADANDAPTREGRPLPSRRPGSVPPKNQSSGTDTYMTARVIRGIARTGLSQPEQAVLAS
jgi:hypothetical protein